MKKTVKPKTTLDKIREIIDKSPWAENYLDDVVHDQATNMASSINNDGLKAQLEFLNQRGVDDESVLRYLEEATASLT